MALQIPASLARQIASITAELMRRSHELTAFFRLRMRYVAMAWFGLFGLLALAKLSFPATPIHGWLDLAQIAVPYVLVLAAPVAGYFIALAAFSEPPAYEQPQFRFALLGRWRALRSGEAQKHPAFGPTGFVTSLLAGMLINVVLRTGEYFLAVPALNARAPDWGQVFFLVMTADVVVMNFFYMVCFVMALRSIPLFPRMLLFAWTLDVALQLSIAHQVSAAGIPGPVAVHLQQLLEGNIHKVMISVAIWVPYLLLSERINVTYRHRLPLTA